MENVAVLLIGLAVGALVACLATYQVVKVRLGAEFDRKLRQTKDEVARDTQRRSSAAIKGRIGERFAPFSEGFGFEPADARFLGSPIDFVVFDGMADGQITGVAFVEVKTGPVPLSPFQRQVAEAIKEGRVDWRIVQMKAQSE